MSRIYTLSVDAILLLLDNSLASVNMVDPYLVQKVVHCLLFRRALLGAGDLVVTELLV